MQFTLTHFSLSLSLILLHILHIYLNQAVQRNTDSRSCTATLLVKVLDTNDNVPVFNPTEYQANITEHSSIGTIVVHLRATDLDVCNILEKNMFSIIEWSYIF